MQEINHSSNPFPGLRPFEAAETHLFFGRDGQSEELLRRLKRTRFLAVVGTSGSGKSSLVRAGLLPALQGGLMASAGSDWRIAILRPGNDPIGNLARALASPSVFGSRDEKSAGMQEVLAETTLRRSSLGLAELVGRARTKFGAEGQPLFPDYENLLVVVDQFEEIFRFKQLIEEENSKEDAAAFVKLLLEAVRQPKWKIYVVLTMRSDFLGDCAQFRELPEAINDGQYLIPRMTRDERREAITGPVAVGEGAISEPLVNQLLNDVGDNPDQLPIMQHALMRTWDYWLGHRRNGDPMDIPDYDATGGMSEALSRHADEAYEELSDAQKVIAEKLFKGLTERGADNREIRRPMEVQEICELTGAEEASVIAVVEVFRRGGRSFLMPPPTDALTGTPIPLTRESLIDISHESLIRNWERLRMWVEEESRSARIYRRLAETAVLHKEGGAGLWRDPDLQVALAWREQSSPNHVWARRYHPEFASAMSFLDESVATRDAQSASDEARRKREIKRTRLTALIFGVAFLFSLAMGVYAYGKKNETQSALYKAEQALRTAEELRVRAENAEGQTKGQAAEAKEQAELARQSESLAREAEGVALAKKKEADELRAEAEKQSAIAHAKAEEARRQQLLAEEQQKLASSRELAADAMSQLQIDPELSLALAGRSAEADRTFEAENALRQSLLESHVSAVAEGHRGEVTVASFTPDGELAVLTAGDNAARVLRLSDGQVVAELRGDHKASINSAAFNPDGTMVVTAGEDKIARIWDWRANRVVHELPHPESVSGARFSPDGAAVITTCEDNAARVWDARTGRRLSPVLYGVYAKLSSHSSHSVTVRPLYPDGRHIFFVSAEEEGEENRPRKNVVALDEVRESVWDVSAGRVLPGLENKLGAVFSADVNVEHNLMFTNGKTLWDLSTGRSFAVLDMKVGTAGAISPSGRFIVTAHDDIARVWEVPQNREGGADKGDDQDKKQVMVAPLRVLSGHSGRVWSVSFSPDGRFILTASDDRTARVWDVKTGLEVSVMRGHRKGLMSAAFSPDGGRMVTSGDDGTARVWDAGMGQGFVELDRKYVVESALFGARSNLVLIGDERTARVWDAVTHKLLPQTWPTHAAALSPDAKLIITARQESPGIHDAATGRVRVELSGGDGETLSAVYSPDGRFAATAESDGAVRVRDEETGKVVKELPGVDSVAGLLFGPGGDLLLITAGSSKAKLWEWKTERPPVDLPDFRVEQSFLGETGGGGAFSPDGRLVAGPSGITAAVWDARTGCRMKLRLPHKASVQSVVFGRDGRSLLSTDPYAAKLWQLPTTLKCEGEDETLKESLALDSTRPNFFPRRNALLSPDGKFIVLTALRNGAAQVWDASTGELKFKLGGDSTTTHGVALSSDSRRIVTASGDGMARVWDSGTGDLLLTLKGNPAIPLSAVSFSPDDKLIVTVSDPRFNVVTVWDAVTGLPAGETLRGHSASFSPDSKSVLTLSGGDVARVSGVSDGRAVAELQGLTGKVTHLAFSDDGRRVVAATSDRKVWVWDAVSGRNLARREYAGDIKTLTLSRDGRHIATTTESDGNTPGAQVWDAEADKISEFGEGENVNGVALSPDGRLVAWTQFRKLGESYLNMTKVSNLITGDEMKDLAGGHPAFSPDGKRLVTVSDDVARVWDAGTCDSVAELRGHAGSINSAAFSPDGQFIVTAGDDNVVLVWDAETGVLETRLFGDFNDGLLSAAFSPDGASILVVGKDKAARLYACVICGGWGELIEQERGHFARHPRPLTPGEQKKFTRQTPSGVPGAPPVGAVEP